MNVESPTCSAPPLPAPLPVAGETGRLPGYMPELDGLRAVAILSVMAFHLQLPFCSLGWAGVFLFFVLSGFLITGILLDAKSDRHYFRNFYARRALRIFPIYYVTLFALVALAIGTHKTIHDAGWYFAYLQNYLLGVNSFLPAFPAAFDHSWSLAVEEQFYLLWPLAVLVLARRALLGLCVALFVGAGMARFAVADLTGSFSLAFTPLACVVDSLAAGAILAVLRRSPAAGACGKGLGYTAVAVGGGSALLIIAHNGLERFWTGWMAGPSINHLLLTSLAILFGGLILVALDRETYLAAVLRLGVLRHLGKISYGLYMYHWPLLLFLPGLLKKCGWDPRFRYWLPIYLVVTYLVALASWHFFEKKLIALKRHFAGGARAAERQLVAVPNEALRITEPDAAG
jgi:peptidoglycan/LPS O-acetylase OafA/YrhL